MSGKLAVIELNNKQFLVKENDYIKIDRLSDPKISVISIIENDIVQVGDPFLDNYGVELELIENKKDKKITVSRFRNKSRYRKNKGFRASISVLKVNSIGESVKSKLVKQSTELKKVVVKKRATKNTVKDIKD